MRARLSADPAAIGLAAWLAATLLLNLALGLWAPERWRETALTHLGEFARGESGEDSWGPMKAGLAHVESDDPRPVYQAVLFGARIKFQYPPASLLALELARGLAARAGARLESLLNAFTWLAVVATVVCAAAILRAGRPPGSRLAAALMATAAFLFYPLLKAYTLGQVQAWISALLALLLLSWQAGRRGLAGVLLGLVCLLKPHFAAVALWAVLRREGRFALAALLTALAGVLASLLRYGLPHNLDYLPALAFLGRHGESFHPNQSLMGLMHRLLRNGNNVEWVSDAFPPFHPVVFCVAGVGSAAILGLALLWRRGGPGRGGAMDLAAMLLACTMASPIAWEHHYGVLVPVFALLVSDLGRPGMPGGARAVLFCSALVAANLLAPTLALADGPWNPLQSYLYFAAVASFALLLVRRGAAQDAVSKTPTTVSAP